MSKYYYVHYIHANNCYTGMMNSSSTAIDCSAEKISIAVTIALVCGLIMVSGLCMYVFVFNTERKGSMLSCVYIFVR